MVINNSWFDGLITTADAFNLFVFLEISSLSAVALVALGSKDG